MKLTQTLWMTIVVLVIAVVALATHVVTVQTDGFTTQPIKIQSTPTSFSDEQIHTFANTDELELFLETQSNYGYADDMMIRSVSGDMMMESAVDSVSAPSAGSASKEYSETNVQVSGIDEGDLIKTNGEYIYTITENTLFVIKTNPANETEVVSQMAFENWPAGLFLVDDMLVVYGSVNWEFSNRILPQAQMSFMQVYDTTNPENLELVDEVTFEGYIQETREKDGEVYIVANANANFADPYPTPIIMRDDVIRSIPVESIYYFGYPYNPSQYTTVHKISLDDFEMEQTTVVTNWGTTVYMSNENIYLSTAYSVNEYEIMQEVAQEVLYEYLTIEDKEKIDRINIIDIDILSASEKEYKVQQIYELRAMQLDKSEQETITEEIEKQTQAKLESYDYFTHTTIQRIDLDELEVEATGKVPGRLNNQFSLDEYDEVLRVATTIDARWSQFSSEQSESENHVYTLDEDLVVLDGITGLAKDESIYATRFIGERLYMVTFRQIDPFFVIDLADAENIEVLGELKIPGFSRYLHPYDENTIIGIGQDADEKTGRAQGLKISLFDVSDVANPIESAQFVTNEKYAQSQALYEHKAFLFDREKNLLVIPAYSPNYYWDEEGQTKRETYNGAFVFNITQSSIELRGLIDHDSNTGNYWQPQVERSLYIGNNLFTKSSYLLRVNALDDLSSVANVTLSPEGQKPDGIIVY